jgi:hypothetical protein
MAEIEDAKLADLQRANQLLANLLDDPKDGLSFKRKIKEKYPNANLPDVAIIEQATAPVMEELTQTQARLDALDKTFNDYKASVESKEAEGQLRGALDKVQKEYSFTDEKMAEVVETMRTQDLAHAPEAAAALVAKSLPHATPTGSRSSLRTQPLDIYGMQSSKIDEAYRTLHERPWDFFESQVFDVLDEFQGAA